MYLTILVNILCCLSKSFFYPWSNAGSKHLRITLSAVTKALYYLTFIAGSLFLIVLLIIPSAPFALFAAYMHCSMLFMSELSIILKSFSLSTTCN